MTQTIESTSRRTSLHLASALHRSPALSRSGIQERLFSYLFRGLVYPQIWEDPVIDMDALNIRRSDHIVAIASGGCNVMSYLCAQPARVTAIDLNNSHVALVRLKRAAAETLADYRHFHAFFGQANRSENVEVYYKLLAPRLDRETRAYWEARTFSGRRRISRFARGFYHYGLLGGFIGAAHKIARLHGINPRDLLKSGSLAEQKQFFETRLAPLVSKPLIRWISKHPAALYGLGIPPKQYESLSGDKSGDIIAVLLERLEHLACGFDLRDNYFAWQAFGRSYAEGENAPLPPYLEKENFSRLRATVERLDIRHDSVTAFMRRSPPESIDCVAMLDAQDWMNPADLNDLWLQITRTARPGARVIFRTAANELVLPGKVDPRILSRWRRDDARSDALHKRDRSAIYGAFHLYRFEDHK